MAEMMPQPLAPVNAHTARHEGRSLATEATRRCVQRTKRSPSPSPEAGTPDMYRLEKIRLLEEQIQLLREELAYHVRLDIALQNFVKEASLASERLQTAVLQFRDDQKATDHEFMRSRQL